jgi:DUF2934 family protein
MLCETLHTSEKLTVMAKRNPPRAQAEDSATVITRPPRPRRTKATAGSPSSEIPSATLGVESAALGVESTDNRWSPSQEEIRHRAYERYLERGGGDGMAFEDWLDAERELKTTKSQVTSLKSEV